MTATKRIEYQISRQLLLRRHEGAAPVDHNPWVDRLIAVLALTAGLLILGSYLEQLLWAVVAATTVITLR